MVYLAHMGCGFPSGDREKDPGTRASWQWVGECQSTEGSRSSCHVLTQVQGLVDHAFHLPHSEPGGPHRDLCWEEYRSDLVCTGSSWEEARSDHKQEAVLQEIGL